MGSKTPWNWRLLVLVLGASIVLQSWQVCGLEILMQLWHARPPNLILVDKASTSQKPTSLQTQVDAGSLPMPGIICKIFSQTANSASATMQDDSSKKSIQVFILFKTAIMVVILIMTISVATIEITAFQVIIILIIIKCVDSYHCYEAFFRQMWDSFLPRCP